MTKCRKKNKKSHNWRESHVKNLAQYNSLSQELQARGKDIVIDVGRDLAKIEAVCRESFDDTNEQKETYRKKVVQIWGPHFRKHLFPRTCYDTITDEMIRRKAGRFMDFYRLSKNVPGLRTNNIPWSFFEAKGIGPYRSAIKELKDKLPSYYFHKKRIENE